MTFKAFIRRVAPAVLNLFEEVLYACDRFSIRRNPCRVVEQVALEGFKSGQLTIAQVRRLLGFETRTQAHEFLATHGTPCVDYSVAEAERERRLLAQVLP